MPERLPSSSLVELQVDADEASAADADDAADADEARTAADEADVVDESSAADEGYEAAVCLPLRPS